MALEVKQVRVWASSIEDKPGGLAAKLDALSAAGANLEFVIARRAPDKPGTGVVFIAGLEGDAQVQAAGAAGFATTDSLHSVRISGPDRPGLGSAITGALAAAGINLRGLSAAALGGEMVCYLALDTSADAGKVAGAVKDL